MGLFDFLKKDAENEEIDGEDIEKIEEMQNSDKKEVEEEISPIEEKQGFFTKLVNSLNKTRDNIMTSMDNVLSGFSVIDEDLFEELEEILIMSDLGVQTSTLIIDKLKKLVKERKETEPEKIKGLLIEIISDMLTSKTDTFELKKPTVILVIGVNGVGKTTTIGKLANLFKSEGKKVLLAAGDTFRAAAIDQLEIWGDRVGVKVIKHQENSDPAAVVFDACKAAKARDIDVLICDTAGRLHNKKNLMDELKKMYRIIGKEYPEANTEVFLVLDATTGQNALQQAKLFNETSDITGIVLTKLDGTAKGGIVLSIKNELEIPVRFIGIGEGINDLRAFDSADFAKALF